MNEKEFVCGTGIRVFDHKIPLMPSITLTSALIMPL